MLKPIAFAVLAATAVATMSVAAQPAPMPEPDGAQTGASTQIDEVVVSGKVSGPEMWHAYIDDDHDLWIFGTMKPLPANMQWDDSDVRGMVQQAQEVLWYPSYSVNVKANFFQEAMLGFKYMRAMNNPDGKALKDVLDPALYARWQAAKARYMPGNSGVERKRPVVAAEELLAAATKRAGLSWKYSFHEAIKPTIESAGVKDNLPKFEVKLSAATAKAALSDIRQTNLDDARCLAATIDAVNTDLPRMVANANAWARGDVGAISYAALARRNTLCMDVLMSPEFSAKYGLPNITDSIENLWMREARDALQRNRITVAYVPMELLIGSGNLLDRLRSQGYTVSGP